VTDTYFGGSFDLPEDDKLTLDRAYVRVDRKKMQRLIKDRFRQANGVVIESKLESQLVAPNIFDDHLVHDSRGSTLTLLDGSRVRSKLVIDATG
jgi:lycopene beta-cyclase